MSFFDLLTMVGGLALFLYGMSLMGDGLSKASGGRLEIILEKLTSSPLKAVLIGTAVTAIIQSSSATTVMVVGFVNSGIMNLQQAVGIIMGANVGTTVTSWILSLSGIQSSSLFIQLLKPSSFTPILAMVGVIMMMVAKKDQQKFVSSILIGFAVLIFGMETMSDSVAPLADVPEFTNILLQFSHPLLGMLAGLVLTAVIQSSSASVGILQALCVTGAVSFGAAIPIIMGQNIGTCVTALLSSIGASKNAKRAALIHLYFNLIGTILFMVIFYAIHSVRPFDFLDDSASAMGIAVVHSVFNISATIVLMPFSKWLVKLAEMSIQEGTAAQEENPDRKVLSLLDARFLDTPAYAVEQSRIVAKAMCRMSRDAMEMATSLLREGAYKEEDANRVTQLEREVDYFEDQLGTYLVRLSSRNLSEKDSRQLSVILHSIGDFERISDHARNIAEAAKEMHEKKLHFSDKAQKELLILFRAIQDILQLTEDAFQREDMMVARKIEPLEEVIDVIIQEMKQRHVKRLRKGKCTIELGFILSDITTNLERASDHCSNIGVCLLEVSEDEYDTHAYLKKLKNEENSEFQGKVNAYKERYLLP